MNTKNNEQISQDVPTVTIEITSDNWLYIIILIVTLIVAIFCAGALFEKYMSMSTHYGYGLSTITTVTDSSDTSNTNDIPPALTGEDEDACATENNIETSGSVPNISTITN